MNDNDIAAIKAVIITLGDEEKGVSVRGSKNMNKILGCVNVLTDIINRNEKETTDG